MFSSCTKRPVAIQSSNDVEKELVEQHCTDALMDSISQQEAMLVDIPIPLYDCRILPTMCDEIDRDTLVFGYKSPLSYNQAVEFFMSQMERYGWRHLVSFDSCVETIMQFNSPDRYCTVVIKKSASESECLSIFIYIKRAGIESPLSQ